ncbi:MAG: hypothetical protein CM1200mP17_10170 [Woeseia sp.]|nr:MAG: hypothetical protein CM1200mP17_10170 [Woeseia sp.]
MSGNFLDGFLNFFKNTLSKNILFGFGMFIVLYSGMSTFFYFAIKNILTDIDQDTELKSGQETIWRQISLRLYGNVWHQSSGKTFRVIGNPFVGSSNNYCWDVCSCTLTILWVVVGLQIIRRAGSMQLQNQHVKCYSPWWIGITFKAKSVIDVVVYRAGDIFWGWGFTGLTQVLGVGLGVLQQLGVVWP